MEVYVVYESLYGELQSGMGDSTIIIGVFKNLEDARTKAEELINEDLEDDYVLDNQIENGCDENGGFYRLYKYEQENYSCFYEIIIKKETLK